MVSIRIMGMRQYVGSSFPGLYSDDLPYLGTYKKPWSNDPMPSVQCLGCNAWMVPQTVGDYCHVCRQAIAQHRKPAKALPKPSSRPTLDLSHHKSHSHYDMPPLVFGKRKPRLYVRTYRKHETE